jgi:hypothetical protein
MAATANTTSNRAAADHAGERRFPNLAAGVLAAVVGAVLLVLAIPRFDAAVVALRAETALDALQAHASPGLPLEQLTAAADAAARSSRLAAAPETAAMLGRLHLARALAIGPNQPEGQRALAESRDATRQALALAPGLPFEWLQLSYENLLGPGGAGSAIAPLRMSVHTGRYAYRLLFRRLDLALQLWTDLDAPLRQEFDDQVLVGARDKVNYVAILAWHHHRISELRRMLADQPELLAAFEKDVSRQGPNDYAVIQTSP